MNDIILGGTNTGTEYNLFRNDDFEVSNIDNLTWSEYELSTSTNPFESGDTIQNQRGLARDISIELKPIKDKGNFSKILNDLLKFVGDGVYLQWLNQECDGITSDWVIYGVMDSIDVPRFSNDVRATLNIHCSDPYWRSTKITESSVNKRMKLKGTAPTDIKLFVNGVTIPKSPVAALSGGTEAAYLQVQVGNASGWKFNTNGSNNLTGNLIVDTTKPIIGTRAPSVTLDGTSRLDLVAAPLSPFIPRDTWFNVAWYHPDHLDGHSVYTTFDFTVEYYPRYY